MTHTTSACSAVKHFYSLICYFEFQLPKFAIFWNQTLLFRQPPSNRCGFVVWSYQVPEHCNRPMSICFELQYFLKSVIWQLCSIHAVLIQVCRGETDGRIWTSLSSTFPSLFACLPWCSHLCYYYCVSPLSVTAGSVPCLYDCGGPEQLFLSSHVAFLSTPQLWLSCTMAHNMFVFRIFGLILCSLFLPQSSLHSLRPMPILLVMSKGKSMLGKNWSINMSSYHIWRHKCCSLKATIKAGWKVCHHKGRHD